MVDCRKAIWSHGITLAEVARRLGNEPSHVHHLLSGKLPVTVQMAHRIEAATDHAVTAAQILGFAELPHCATERDPEAA